MPNKLLLFLLLLILLVCVTYAQISGYASYGYGFNSNPLYYYKMEGSHTHEGYLELNYNKEFDNNLLNFKYVGGLSVFKSLQDRNYYEHRFSCSYKMVFSNQPDNHSNLSFFRKLI